MLAEDLYTISHHGKPAWLERDVAKFLGMKVHRDHHTKGLLRMLVLNAKAEDGVHFGGAGMGGVCVLTEAGIRLAGDLIGPRMDPILDRVAGFLASPGTLHRLPPLCTGPFKAAFGERWYVHHNVYEGVGTSADDAARNAWSLFGHALKRLTGRHVEAPPVFDTTQKPIRGNSVALNADGTFSTMVVVDVCRGCDGTKLDAKGARCEWCKAW